MANPHLAGRLLIITETLGGTVPATAANYGIFFTANQAMKIVRVRARWEVASTSGTLQIKKVPSGTAKASGTDVMSATISTAGTADTNASGTLSATEATITLADGDSLALVSGGTLTNLVGLTITVTLQPFGPVAR